MRNVVLLMAFSAASVVLAEAPITIVVIDPPGYGFNDPTPAAPIGGNTGATVGAQRLIALQYAAGIWGSKLDSPVAIRVRAGFESLPCTAQSGTAGGGRPMKVYAFGTADPEILPNIWYPMALANKLSGLELDSNSEDIEAVLNPNLGQPDCLADRTWYYGLDQQAPADGVDMVAFLLHELVHGLGFLPLTDLANGSRISGLGDVYSQYVFDTSVGKTWNEMTDEERATSITNNRHVVWNGSNVRKDVLNVYQAGTPVLRILEPASIASDLAVGTADFGAALAAPGVNAEVVLAVDAADNAGPSRTDACSPLLNGAEVAGRIALVDRGSCIFTQKAWNVQAAGAIGLVVVNNAATSTLAGLGGTDPAITIPAVQITQADGNALKNVLASFKRVSARLMIDADLKRGADTLGRPLLYTPTHVAPGASIGHWDPSATPNQLMEPEIERDVTHALEPPMDLTLSLLKDLGWFRDYDGVPEGVDQCPGSDRGENLVMQGCDTGVRNTTFPTGCRISDSYKGCAGSVESGGFAACVEAVSREMVRVGTIGPMEAGRIQACTVRANHP